MTKREVAVICVVPPELVSEAKASDKVHGLEMDDVVFTSLYTSNIELLANWDASMPQVILFLPHGATELFAKSAAKLIKQMSGYSNFYLITDSIRAANNMKSRAHFYNPRKKLHTYFETLARLGEKSRQLAAA